jgi:hypothetical protein
MTAEVQRVDDYFSHAAINASAIKAGRESMRMMHYEMTRIRDTPTPAMRRGSLIHTAVLEWHKTDDWAICDAPSWGAKGVKAWREENEGRVQVLASEMDNINQIVQSVHSNKHAHALIEKTRHEVELYWEDRIVGKCKARVDGIGGGVLLELKTTKTSLSDWSLSGHSYKLGNHIQFGWYWWGGSVLGGDLAIDPDETYTIWVRQDKDFDCRVTRTDEALVKEGAEEAQEIARKYRIAENLGNFAGVSADIELLGAPGWAQNTDEIDMEGVSDE